MIRNRIAGTAALATFGLAALGAIALAAPGNAETGRASDSSSTTTSTSDAGGGLKSAGTTRFATEAAPVKGTPVWTDVIRYEASSASNEAKKLEAEAKADEAVMQTIDDDIDRTIQKLDAVRSTFDGMIASGAVSAPSQRQRPGF
jgi:hypothetical protein